MPRTLEHHVFEQVGEPGAAGLLVGRADVVPEVDGHDRQPGLLPQDDLQPVPQPVLLGAEVEMGDGHSARRPRPP